MRKKEEKVQTDMELDIMVSELREYLDCMADNICLKSILSENHKHHNYKKYPFMMTTFILVRDMIEDDASKITKKLMADYFKGKTNEQSKVQ